VGTLLIQEVRDITDLPYSEIDERLGLPEGQAFRYAQYPIDGKTRAPQAESIQSLENRVAKLLKRLPHRIVIENDAIGGVDIGTPDTHPNLGELKATDLQLGYEGDWPTYRRLKTSDPFDPRLEISIAKLVAGNAPPAMWPEMFLLYGWQWGILWDCGLPWLDRVMYNQPPDADVMSFLPRVTEYYQNFRARYADVGVRVWKGEMPPVSDGNLPEWCIDLCLSAESYSDEFHSNFR